MKILTKATRKRSKSLSNLSPRTPRIKKNHARKRSNTVKGINMLAVMSSDQARDISKDFLTTGRTGRRNALPDILGENARTSVADLPDQLGALSTSDDAAGCSKDSAGPSSVPPSSVPETSTTSTPSATSQSTEQASTSGGPS